MRARAYIAVMGSERGPQLANPFRPLERDIIGDLMAALPLDVVPYGKRRLAVTYLVGEVLRMLDELSGGVRLVIGHVVCGDDLLPGPKMVLLADVVCGKGEVVGGVVRMPAVAKHA